MSADPFERFLGVSASADPMELLGVTAQRCDPVSIEAALLRRIEEVFGHPEGRSHEAEQVRRRLRRAAQTLKERFGRPASSRRPPRRRAVSRPAPLTAFDRQVLAVLAGCGGWNSTSRAYLVALACGYGVTVGGLMRVIEGLSAHARSGGPALGVAEITAGARPRPAAAGGDADAGEQAASTSLDLLRRLTPELTGDTMWSRIKLSLLFGLLTILVGVIGVRILFFPAPSSVAPVSQRDAGAMDAPVEPVDAVGVLDKPAPDRLRLARFRWPPTFRGAAPPLVAINNADRYPKLARDLDLIARKIIVSEAPSDAVFRDWDALVEILSTGWVLADKGARRAADRALLEVLHAASDSPSVGDRLLDRLTPLSGRVAEPLDLWRGAWYAGMLGRIAGDTELPTTIVERARIQLEVAYGANLVGAAPGFDGAAAAWLDAAVEQLVDVLEFDEQIYDSWELWLGVQRRLGEGERSNLALMKAIEAVLRSPADLARPGPSVDVLGRLLATVDLISSPIVKHRLLGLLDVDAVEARDLWVLTSLVAQSGSAPWFDERLVLPPSADWKLRRRVRDLIRDQWPYHVADGRPAQEQPRGLPVDPIAGERWARLSDRLLETSPAHRPDGLMRQLLVAARLNEAATRLAAGQPAELVEQVLDEVDRLAESPARARAAQPPNPRRPVTQLTIPRSRPGQAIGRDGEWAEAYDAVGRNREERLKLLRALRTSAGTDLGPIDAEIVVREAYRGSPQEVRVVAQSILVGHFPTGSNVAMELLDQFPDAPRNEGVHTTLRKMTGRLLPSVRSESWAVEARLALVGHALLLRPTGTGVINQGSEALIETYLGRLAALRGEAAPSAAPTTPRRAASLLRDAWVDQAKAVTPSGPAVPADLPALRQRQVYRLRLAEGPLQQFVAGQLGVLDLLTFVTVAEQPGGREIAGAILAESAKARQDLTHVLAQSLEVERTIARMWRLRLAIPDVTASRSEGATGPGAPGPASTLSPPGATGSLPASALCSQDVTDPRAVHQVPRDERVRRPLWGLGPARALAPGLASLALGYIPSPLRGYEQWHARLEALRAEEPLAYFELAEEVADAAADRESLDLARRLFGLAGALDPYRFGPSACLALADLETDDRAKRRLLALAGLLDERHGGPAWRQPDPVAETASEAIIALTEAFSHYRRGYGARARNAMRSRDAMALLSRHEHVLLGGLNRFLEDCRLYNDGRLRPMLSGSDITRMLRFEAAMLAGPQRSWSGDLLLTRGRVLVEVDPEGLEEAFDVVLARPLYRGGVWVQRAVSP